MVIREVDRDVGGGHRGDVAMEIGPVDPCGPKESLGWNSSGTLLCHSDGGLYRCLSVQRYPQIV